MAIHDHQAIAADLWNRYARLAAGPKLVLRLKSLVWLPTGKGLFLECLTRSGSRAPDRKAWASPGEPSMHLDWIAEAFGQITPGNAGTVAVQNGLDEEPVVTCGHPDRALPAGQQVLDPVPLIITQSVAAHRSAPLKLTA